MMPGTAAKHDRLVALAQAEYGWTPEVSGPDDAYRTLAVQIEYKRLYGRNAAEPRHSSHGGSFDGFEAGAVDYWNWSDVEVDAFFDLSRRAGFEPGYFMGQNGRPWEPWHVIDRTPWDAPTLIEQSEEDEMFRLYFITDNVDGNGGQGWILQNMRTGKNIVLRADTPGAQDSANGWARAHGNARHILRQDWLNVLDAIKRTQ